VFGINPSEFVVLLVVAAVVLGPERLPQYAAGLARLVRELRRMAQGATDQVRAELGPEFDDVDWRKLDPRQYDPRRIVREALADTFDPDDPLGLKAGTADKPVSRGGPGDRTDQADQWYGPPSQRAAHPPSDTDSDTSTEPRAAAPIDPDAT
jgi:sec-independent protein translocase protein TatB